MQEVMCGSMYYNMYIMRYALGISCYGVLFAMCCIVCTGVRHMKHSERKGKVGDAFFKRGKDDYSGAHLKDWMINRIYYLIEFIINQYYSPQVFLLSCLSFSLPYLLQLPKAILLLLTLPLQHPLLLPWSLQIPIYLELFLFLFDLIL